MYEYRHPQVSQDVRSRIGSAAVTGNSTGAPDPFTSIVIFMNALRGCRRFHSLASQRMASSILP